MRGAASLVVAVSLMAMPGVGRADPAGDRQLANAWQALEVVIERYNAVADDLQATDARLEQVNSRLRPLEAQVEAAQRETDEAAAALYRSGAIGSTSVLITASSPESWMDQLATLDQIARRRSGSLRALQSAQDQLHKQQAELAVLRDQQRSQQAELGQRKTTIEAQLRTWGDRRVAGVPAGALHDGFVPAFTDDAAGRAVRFAFNQLGKVYQWGAEGPNTFDCSGLTMAAWKTAGVILPHNAARQKQTVTPITRDELQPGDLVFYYKNVSHVGLYIGDGRVVEAPRAGERISMRLLDYAPIAGYGRPNYE